MIPDRVSRLNSLIQTELSAMMERYQERWSSLPSGFLLTITRVVVERNLEQALVYYSWTAPEPTAAAPDQQKEVQKILDNVAYELAHELAGRVRLRRFPKLIFTYDPNIEAGDRVFQIFKTLDREKRA